MHQNKFLSQPPSARVIVMSHAATHQVPITWWLAGPPSRGCYLHSQIFSGQSEAGIGIRSSKGVDWHYFHVTCFKFELERFFEGCIFTKLFFCAF